jgi:signal transduction histidine kinase
MSDQKFPIKSSSSDLRNRLSKSGQTKRYEQELKQAIEHKQEALAKLDYLRHTFLDTVNHEMRTPLVLILQSIELLDSSRLGSMTADQIDTLMVLKRQAQKLDGIVQSLIRVAGFLSTAIPNSRDLIRDWASF